MLNNKLDIKKIAKIFDENSLEDGFHLYEFENLWREIYLFRVQRFLKDFKTLFEHLIELKEKNEFEGKIDEWDIHFLKEDMFPNDIDSKKAYKYYIEAQRSSQTVKYSVFYDDIVKCFDVLRTEDFKKNEYIITIKNNEPQIIESNQKRKLFRINPHSNLNAKMTVYQELALFGNWFYRLKNEL